MTGPATDVADPGGGRPARDAAGLQAGVDHVLRVPDRYRQFDASAQLARRRFGLDGPMLERLVGSGLPHRPHTPDQAFCRRDLSCVSLFLGLRSAERDAMRGWDRAMASLVEGRASYRIDVRASCPDPGHEGLCRYSVLTRQGHHEVTTSLRSGVVLASHECRTEVRAVTVPAAVTDLARAYDDVAFYPLPLEASRDASLIEERRVSDCLLMARTLRRRAHERGLSARTSFGLVTASPFSAKHMWTEFHIDGKWVPVDPFMARTLRLWGVISGTEDRTRQEDRLSGIYARLSDEYAEIVRHAGEVCEPTYAARRRAEVRVLTAGVLHTLPHGEAGGPVV